MDSGMVGVVEQEFHVDSEIFIPGMVRSGYVKTILRKRERLGKPYVLLLPADKHIWIKDMEAYRRVGILDNGDDDGKQEQEP
jgi:hypothetical protein